MTNSWDPALYLKFEKERTQPAIDLAMRVHTLAPTHILDIGCGPGNSTQVLRRVFPQAKITGIDTSPEMIEQARRRCPDCDFAIETAENVPGQYDLIFSNACLQWVPDHRALLPKLMAHLTPGGVLAVQMPQNGSEPLYRAIREVLREAQWAFLAPQVQTNRTETVETYCAILSACTKEYTVWQTKYYHRLPGHKALTDWVKSTKLRPYLACMDDAQRARFENEILQKAKALYRPLADGSVLLGFNRLFFTAVKQAPGGQ